MYRTSPSFNTVSTDVAPLALCSHARSSSDMPAPGSSRYFMWAKLRTEWRYSGDLLEVNSPSLEHSLGGCKMYRLAPVIIATMFIPES
jgi:hypothetical protein